MHVPQTHLHAYQNRALDLVVDVDTEVTAAQISGAVFEFGNTEKALIPEDGGAGVLIPVSLTAADLPEPGSFRWECRAIIGGQPHTLATGVLRVDPEPTEA